MQFGVLGPLLVCDGDTPLDVAAARQRVLLAALLVRAGQAVSADALAEIVWDESPPPAAAATLRTHVMRLRRVLGSVGGARVITRPPGYLVKAGEQEVDLLRFSALCRESDAAVRAGDWQRAFDVLGDALGLWRGRVLADVSSQILHRDEAPGIEQRRLQVIEQYGDAGLHLGRHADLVTRLQDLAAAHPIRERFHAQLMLALYRCGRRSEALTAYKHARQVLAAELSVAPGPELQELNQRILAADPNLLNSASCVSAQVHLTRPNRFPPVLPRQLPAAVPHFTGRQAELELLTSVLDHVADSAGTPVIIAISGMAGVGKSALAVHWGHQIAERFPDGQLYVNLCGFDPAGTARTPEQAIRIFLDGLQAPAELIPADSAARVGLYRSLTADRRILVLLDNALDERQVRPLLPASPTSMVIVTSRCQLPGLITSEGARHLTLDVLSETDARELLTRRLGIERLAGESEAATELVRRCGRLPLALAVMAARASAGTSLQLTDLAAELRDDKDRLDILDNGDAATSVRAAFSWSYLQLSPTAALMFRRLGRHPSPDVTIPAAAAIMAVPPRQARELLRELVRASLLTERAPGRFTLHDLLSAYAAEQARTRDDDAERRA